MSRHIKKRNIKKPVAKSQMAQVRKLKAENKALKREAFNLRSQLDWVRREIRDIRDLVQSERTIHVSCHVQKPEQPDPYRGHGWAR